MYYLQKQESDQFYIEMIQLCTHADNFSLKLTLVNENSKEVELTTFGDTETEQYWC